METYHLQLQQNTKLILTLVFVPIIATGGFFVALLSFPKLSEWLLILSISAFLILLIVLILWLIKRLLLQSCTISIDENGLSYTINQSALLYKKNFSSSWDNISNISEMTDVNCNKRFFRISFKQPRFTLTFNALPAKDPEADAFYVKLCLYKQRFNALHDNKITSKGFYDSWWAKGITYITYIAFVLIILIKIADPNSVEWMRIISFSCFGSIWLINYHANAREKAAA